MRRVIGERDFSTWEVLPEDRLTEATQNLAAIVTTPRGSVPMCRECGLSQEWKGRRDAVGKALLTRDCFTAVQDQEPRASLLSAGFERQAADGQWTAVLEVEFPNG